MLKKKAQKIYFITFRFLARAFVLDLPIIPVLILLTLLKRIDIWAAVGIFGGIYIVTSVITVFAFHESEKFITYLSSLAQGSDIETPRFHKGIFGSFRLAHAFLSVKKLWSEQTLSDANILDNLPDPLLMLNAQGEIVFANQVAHGFLGENLLYQPICEIIIAESFLHALDLVLSENSKHEWTEFDYQDEQVYSFQMRMERLPAPAKNGAVIVVVLHDITQLKLFKQEQTDFFANASHELKTPLSIISGFIETLQGPAKDDEAAREKFLALMAEQTQRMTQLVQDLLALSKLQMEKTQRTDVILLPEMLKGVIENLTLKAEQHHKELKLDLLHDIPRLKGNKMQLVQVFQNLIDNAIKYGAPHSVITITAQLCNGFPQKSDKYLTDLRQVVLVRVHNTGNPIAPQNINRLFERFYRVDTLRTKSVEGTGLGLGIAQQIVNEHDGLIDIKSSAAHGTTFRVYLPIDL